MNLLKRTFEYFFGNHPFQDKIFDYNQYWDEHFQNGGYFVAPAKLKFIEREIDKGSRVLDIGCGNGLLLNHLKETRNIQGRGIEISRSAAELARSKGLEVIQADLTSPDFELEGTYEYIIISEVLEHLPRPEEVMEKLKNKFTKYLIITVPNSGYFFQRLRLLLGKFPRQWRYHPSEHLRFWTVSDFYFWLKQLGFKVKKYYGLPFGFSDDAFLLWKLLPRLFSRQGLFVVVEDK